MSDGSAAMPMRWAGFGESIRGAAHQRNGLPNQDRWEMFPSTPGKLGPPLVCAVADGHGSPKSFRSEKGAAFATTRARKVVQQFLKTHTDLADPANLQYALKDDHLPRDLVLAWQKAVDDDLLQFPLRDAELDHLEQAEGTGARRQVLANPYLAYGATLLVTLITRQGLVFLQLGDGDILLVAEDGATRRPLAADPRLMANETTSLCMRAAWHDFRTGWLPQTEPVPALILLSTDGYSNSFQDDKAFLQVGADLLGLLRSEGAPKIHHNLRGWLEESSQSGSGDDITLAVLYRCGAIQRPGACVAEPYEEPDTAMEPEEKTDE
jgi:serine/threonine protein phosphatase PrpC